MASESVQPADVFNPDLPREQTPDFTGASKGTKADTSLGQLFEGAGKLFGDLVQAKDQWYKNIITEQATQGVDQIHNEFGVGSAETIDRTIVPNKNQPTPKEIDMAVKNLQGLKQSAASGNMNYSNYLARLESVSRQLRSRYPGYREHIDAEMSQLTGVKSANALVRELFSESTKENSAEKREEAFINSHIKDIPPQYWIDRRNGVKWEFDKLRQEVNIRVYNDANQNIRQNQINTDNLEGNLDRRKAKDSAVTDLAQSTAIAMRNNGEGWGANYKDLKTRVAASRGPNGEFLLDAPAIEAMKGLATQIKMQRDAILMDKLNNQRLGGPNGKTYSELLSPADKQEIIDNYNKETQYMLSDFAGKDVKIDTISAKSAYNEAMITDERYRAFQQDHMKKSHVLREIMGPDAYALHLREGENMAAFQKSVKDYMTTSVIVNNTPGRTGPIKTVADAVKFAQDNGEKDPKIVKSTINTLISTIANEKAPMQAREAAVMGLYGPGMQGFINGGSTLSYQDRKTYWDMMTTPQVAQSIYKMKQDGNEAAWANYKNWSTDTMYNLFKQDMQSMARIEEKNERIDIRYSPESQTFSVVDIQTGRPVQSGDFSGRFVTRTAGEVAAEGAKDRMNAAIHKLTPLWKLEGTDPNTALLHLFNEAGMSLSTEKVIQKGNIPGEFFRAFRDGVKSLFEITEEQKASQASGKPIKKKTN